MSYGLSPAALSTIFPFHFVVDGQLRLRQAGPALSILAPSLRLGDPMQDHFLVERPEGARPPVDEDGRADALYMIRSVHNGTRLRGEWVVLEGAAMFVGSPWVTATSELSKAGLTLNDFARHDPVSDYLVLFKTLQMALTDSEQLQRDLRQHKASLQDLVDARTEALTAEMDKVARSERALARQKELLQGVFDGIPVMIVVLDGDGEVQLVNPELQRVLGHGLEGWQEGGVLEVLLPEPDDRERFAALMRTSPQPWQELAMKPRDGDVLATSWCSVPFVDGIICIGQDVTVRQKAEWLQKQVERTERLAGIGQLAAGIAHEVNNPATYVLTNLEIMQDLLVTLEEFVGGMGQGTPPADQVEAMREQVVEMKGMVGDNLDGMLRIRKIVRDLSTFSHFRQEEIEWVELGEVVDAACRLVSTEIRHRAQLVRPPITVPRIAADRGKLVQMVVNLLVNAAHAIDTGDAVHNEVRVSAAEGDDGAVLLTVSDTGRGIQPELVERVFEPFFTTKPRGVGTGLGLSLCAQIARMHHATISVDSAPGRGTRFTIIFPRDTGLRPSPTEPAAAPAKAVAAVASTVLVVDDEPAILKAYRRVLESEHEVVVAGSGQEAIDLLLGDGATAFDVILCDLMMPDVDGPMLYQTVRERAPHLLSRIIFFSGGAFSNRARELVSSIPNMVLEKPIEKHVLRRVVAELSAARRG